MSREGKFELIFAKSSTDKSSALFLGSIFDFSRTFFISFLSTPNSLEFKEFTKVFLL